MELDAPILLAEDHSDDIMLTRWALERAGLPAPQVVPDGRAVLQYLRGDGPYKDRRRFPFPSVLLLDLDLPGMNGFQVLDYIRRHPDLRHLPVIVLTKSVFSQDITRAYRLGANSFLTKPTDLLEFQSSLKQVIHFWADPNAPRIPPRPQLSSEPPPRERTEDSTPESEAA